ncbi:hypothetical protein BC937DRAFT_89065 [Endogone sp. FLAS-F59071]|nr:hypothetical protein BC937DRAFT_89065 [Endogone sp. FLAS-F59071]|eukprot:RUS18180.1 hypothetical protein BC937DRAFT_89065 [Endogone sp. FLAS-F59071]
MKSCEGGLGPNIKFCDHGLMDCCPYYLQVIECHTNRPHIGFQKNNGLFAITLESAVTIGVTVSSNDRKEIQHRKTKMTGVQPWPPSTFQQ